MSGRSPIDPIGAALQSYRRARGVSQRDLGEHLGLSQTQVSRIETGARRPSFDERRRIAHTLRLPMSEVGLDVRNEPPDLERVGRIVHLGETARFAGSSMAALPEVEEVDRSLHAAKLRGHGSEALAAMHVRIKLTRAVLLGEVLPRHTATMTKRLTGQALRMAKGIGDPLLQWRASLRHGTALRKASDRSGAIAALEAALKDAPSVHLRPVTLIPLARAYSDARKGPEFRDAIAELRRSLDDPEHWTPGFNPLSVAEVELRGCLALEMKLPKDDGVLDDLSPGIPPGAQWFPIWSFTQAQALSHTGELDESIAHIKRGLKNGTRLTLPQQIERGVVILRGLAARTRQAEPLIEAALQSLAKIELEVPLQPVLALPPHVASDWGQ